MNIKTKLGTAGLVTVALTALALIAPSSAFAANDAPPVVGSGPGQTDVALYVLDAETGAPHTPGSTLSYAIDLVGGPSATDPLAVITAPAGGAAQALTFISPRGQERDYTKWNAMASQGSGTDQALAAIAPSGLATTGQGSPAGTAAVASTGGEYSLGVAWLTDNIVVKTAFAYITVAPGNIATTTFTFSSPAVVVEEVAPAITTQPGNASVNPGATATFTAAASGTPAPTVQWQSKAGSAEWADVAGATSASLTVAEATAAQSGTQYRAVFTNTKGTATTDAATLTVAKVAPEQPTGSAPNNVTIPAPAKGATSVVVPAGEANKGKTLQAWAWSEPTNLGQVTTDATTGDATVDISTLPAGTHTVALTEPGDATFTPVAWGTFTKLSSAGDTLTDSVDVTAEVTASDLWSLEAEKTAIDFGAVQRNQSATRALGKVTVVDDRNELKGWNLDASWSEFTGGTTPIPATALTLSPKAFTGYTLIPGVTLGTSGSKIAESTAVSTLTGGALFDADLTFTAPEGAAVGQYHSTLTLTLTSK